MLEQKNANDSATRRETGVLVFKNHFYALRCSNGAEYWLEMDRSPCHLLDEHVTVEGQFFSPNVCLVETIRPI
jgi:Protein of unknown function (DUF5818)